MKYRAEIDGLRAIAVLPVLFYHAKIPFFSGGFVGVDVFFVISGFLITQVILRGLEQGTFTIVHFYERRVRRIIPALTAVIIACAIATWFFYLPSDFKDFSQSLFATVIFASNFFFWSEAGYFAAPSELKPLLHTWSLAIEEQFYVFFPLLLAGLARYLNRFTKHVMVVGFFASLALSIWAIDVYPSATFYLLPTRAWELLLGTILALGIVPAFRNAVLRNVSALAGLALIVWSVFMYGPGTPFPGWTALLPCMGTALIIHANTHASTWLGKTLSWRPIVFVGLISYSLYLWHWPMIVFSEYLSSGELSMLDKTGVIAASFVAAIASWQFIEKPFRKRDGVFTRGKLFLASGAVAAGLMGFALMGQLTQGAPFRINYSEAAQHYAEAADDFAGKYGCLSPFTHEKFTRLEFCIFGEDKQAEPQFLVWGDSHSGVVRPMFNLLAEEYGITGWAASYGACPALLNIYRVDKPPSHQCKEFNNDMLKFVTESNIKHVVLISRWALHTYKPTLGLVDTTIELNDRFQIFNYSFRNTLEALSNEGVTVWVMEQTPFQDMRVPSVLAKVTTYGGNVNALGISLDEHIAHQALFNQVFDEVSDLGPIYLIRPADVLCADGHCRVESDGESLYKDSNHLTGFGSIFIADVFRPMFAEIQASAN